MKKHNALILTGILLVITANTIVYLEQGLTFVLPFSIIAIIAIFLGEYVFVERIKEKQQNVK